jgi:hypothetical protein
MGVSYTHIALVKAMAGWVEQNCHPNEHSIMLLDLPDTLATNQPPIIGSFRPDLYIKSNRLIIGEAKTARDIETKHSRAQYNHFLSHLSQYQDSLFILAVPWNCVPSTKSLIRRIQKENSIVNVGVLILEKLPG